MQQFTRRKIARLNFHLGAGLIADFEPVGVAHLDEQQPAQVIDHLTGVLARVGAFIHDAIDSVQTAIGGPVGERPNQFAHSSASREAEHLPGAGGRYHCAGGRRQLIQQADRVAQAAGGEARHDVEHFRFGLDVFRRDDRLEPRHDLRDGDAPEVVPLAARGDRERQFVRLGRGQHKYGVRRRFFKRLEQRIECSVGEHVYFVDDVHLVLAFAGREVDLLAQVAHIIHAGVGGGVDLDQIEIAALVDSAAAGAGVVRALCGVFVGTVERLREQARSGRLAGAARPGEQIGVRHPSGAQCVVDGADDVVLPDDLLEARRPPLEVEGLRFGQFSGSRVVRFPVVKCSGSQAMTSRLPDHRTIRLLD